MQYNYSLRKIYFTEGLIFFLIILMIWLDELFDLPHYFFGTGRTPFNWAESVFETILIVCLAIVTFALHYRFQLRIKWAEKLLPICAHCKCIRNGEGYWKQVDDYFSEHSITEFTHTLCPECASLLYPEEFPASPQTSHPGSC